MNKLNPIEAILGCVFDLNITVTGLESGYSTAKIYIDDEETDMTATYSNGLFSFHKDARLDMRMDKDNPLDAYKVVNEYDYNSLVRIFREYGEEKYSSSIAKGIIENRPITTTLELVEVIKANVPEKYKREHHPARRIFQAIRIEVNDELNVFEKSLKQSLELLNLNGRICVITFHSLEDKICKNIFKSVSEIDKNFKKLPIIPDEYMPKFKVIKTIEPKDEELDENNRARSARLRIIERIGR